MDSNFWKAKRVFVTGDSGFKGGWLAYALHLAGANVTGYSNQPSYDPTFFDSLRLDKLYESIRGDVRDAELIVSSMKAAKPDIVFHLAAQPLVRLSYREPLETFSVNALGTATVLNACRGVDSIGAIVNITTDKVYENREIARGYREDESLGGYDPYSASKVCSEVIAKCFRQSYFQNEKLISVRAGNIFGGGDWSEDRLIPDGVRAFSNSSTLTIRNPKSIRPWQHVIDPVRGYLAVAQASYEKQLGTVGAFNLGPPAEQCVPVEQLLELFVKKWGGKASWVVENADANLKETKTLMLDSSLVLQRLGWKTEIDLSTAVDLTVDWYQAALSKSSFQDLRSISENQIKRWG